MVTKFILPLVCALLIAGLSAYALHKGFDGTCLALAIGIIGGLGGYGIHGIKDFFKGKEVKTK